MSRRARRRNEAAPSKSSATNFGRAASRDEPAGLFGSRRRKGRQARAADAKVAAVAAPVPQDSLDGAAAEKLTQAAETKLTLGKPIELPAPALAEPVDATPVNEPTSVPHAAGSAAERDRYPAATGVSMSDDAQGMPLDEDGPYDEIADVSLVNFDGPVAIPNDGLRLQNLPAPNPSDMSPSRSSVPSADGDNPAATVSSEGESAEAANADVDPEQPSALTDPGSRDVVSDAVDTVATTEEPEGDNIPVAAPDVCDSLEDGAELSQDTHGEVESEADALSSADEHPDDYAADVDVHAAADVDVHAAADDDGTDVYEDIDDNGDDDVDDNDDIGGDASSASLVPETREIDTESESEVQASPSGGSHESEVNTDPDPECEAREPEPLVEPAPLARSAFAPDLSKLGRTEQIEPPVESVRVKPVRPLGEEPIFSTADLLRLSAFAPGASQSEAHDRAVTAAAPSTLLESSSPGVTGETAPRQNVSTGTQPRAKGSVPAPPSSPDSPETESKLEEPVSPAQHDAASDELSVVAASADMCSQCGATVTDSDISCGSCGFVKQGIQPGARVLETPALDPFPWGTPSGIDDVESPAISDTPAASDTPAVANESPDGASVADVDANASADAATEVDAVTGAESAISETDGDPADGVERSDAAEVDTNLEARDNTGGAVLDPEGSSDEESVDFSALAPPPMSHQRVDLAILPPTSATTAPTSARTPASANGQVDFDAVEEDLEDTRIVERSNRGTRFVLQFSTGDSVIVTGTGLTGRNPTPEPSENFDTLVPITDPSKSVSKTHLEFGQVGGVFWISDRYSGNGTTVREPGADPKRCEPGKRYRVVRGTRVEIGEQFFIVS